MDKLDLAKLSIVGFTGTRTGMTEEQKNTVSNLLGLIEPNEVHHGDCIGADAQFHELAMSMGIRVVIHPASGVGEQRAYCSGSYFTHDARPPLERNKDIVDACTDMIATPVAHKEVLRSGTWATIRYARKQGVSLNIVLPDSSLMS